MTSRELRAVVVHGSLASGHWSISSNNNNNNNSRSINQALESDTSIIHLSTSTSHISEASETETASRTSVTRSSALSGPNEQETNSQDNQESQQEQEQIPDIYGQIHDKETPEMIAQKLLEFDHEVETNIPLTDKASLIKAMERCPEELTYKFKLSFLRVDHFRVPAAAKRYVAYWNVREIAFGEARAFQPLTLSNCRGISNSNSSNNNNNNNNQSEKDPLDLLSLGVYIPIPLGDRLGIFHVPGRLDRSAYDGASSLKVFFYIAQHLLESPYENTQRKGVILLGWGHGYQLSQLDVRIHKNGKLLQGTFPLRMSAYHLCQPPLVLSIVLPVARALFGERMTKRLIVHHGNVQGKHKGNHNKIVQRLSEVYGIPVQQIPQELGGDLDTPKYFEQWLADRLAE